MKLKHYDEYFCHELNLFLFIKDKPFFQKVVRPLITSKLRKDLIDYFLLNDIENVENYTETHLFNKLNSIEMILLTFALQTNNKLRRKTFNFFTQKQKLLKISAQKLDKLFRTAMAEKQLNKNKESEKHKQEVLKRMREQKKRKREEEEYKRKEEEEMKLEMEREEARKRQEQKSLTIKVEKKGFEREQHDKKR
eukprot:280020_1